jgi:signal transduction histidine kinase
MRLSAFIGENLEAIMAQWESYAREIQPPPGRLSREELRDSVRSALEVIADDMRVDEDSLEQYRRSHGQSTLHRRISEVARAHASDRMLQGFKINQIAAEFRALRASVSSMWLAESGPIDRDAVLELVRFGEGVDQLMTESTEFYAETLERARGLFMGALGHDLRSPLSAIYADAEALASSGKLDRDLVRVAARMQKSAKRMKKMVEDLLDFTRTRLGGILPIMPDNVELGELLRRIIDELGAYHPEARLELELGEDLSGRWDSARIEQLASNLILNALQHARASTPVTVRASGEKDHVVLAVHNIGSVIPTELWRVIFDPLIRASVEGYDKPRSERSYGLGLYIAKQIVEAHHGQLDVVSSADGGTTFEARLPRRGPAPLGRH